MKQHARLTIQCLADALQLVRQMRLTAQERENKPMDGSTGDGQAVVAILLVPGTQSPADGGATPELQSGSEPTQSGRSPVLDPRPSNRPSLSAIPTSGTVSSASGADRLVLEEQVQFSC